MHPASCRFLIWKEGRNQGMKFLTLNSHSWMEENAQQKFETLKEQILEAQYDVICFQEVNQEMASETVRNR